VLSTLHMAVGYSSSSSSSSSRVVVVVVVVVVKVLECASVFFLPPRKTLAHSNTYSGSSCSLVVLSSTSSPKK
jgi:hypothetical protein